MKGRVSRRSIALSSVAGPSLVFRSRIITDFVEEQGWDVHFKGLGFYFFKKGACLFQEIFVAGLEPLDQD